MIPKTNRSGSNMKTLSYVVMCAALVFLGFTLGRVTTMQEQKPAMVEASAVPEKTRFILREYTGVGSGVYKHGTIVRVVDGQPQVVGNFSDETGALSPGTVELVEVR